jgi:hypothetical protein
VPLTLKLFLTISQLSAVVWELLFIVQIYFTGAIQAVRYAASITLHVQLQPDQTKGLIEPPYLSISFKTAVQDDYNNYNNATVCSALTLFFLYL